MNIGNKKATVLTVQRNNKSHGTVGRPFFDFTNVGGQCCFIHGTVEDLAPGRHYHSKKRSTWEEKCRYFVFLVFSRALYREKKLRNHSTTIRTAAEKKCTSAHMMPLSLGDNAAHKTLTHSAILAIHGRSKPEAAPSSRHFSVPGENEGNVALNGKKGTRQTDGESANGQVGG